MVEHPIEGLMKTAMESIKEMVDVNTIVGDAVQAPDGTVIIPISRVSFGFASGGGEYSQYRNNKEKDESKSEDYDESYQDKFPFAGGSGAGVSINPVAFMVVGNGQMKLLPVNINSSVDKMLDIIPEFINRANEAMRKKMQIKKEVKIGNATTEDSANENEKQ